MTNIRKKIELHEARKIISELPVTTRSEMIPITKALGRVCANDIPARLPHPAFDRSPFDGYAYRASDTECASKESPVTLKINQEILFNKINIRPGGSLLAYMLHSIPVLALSGNPGAAALGLLFVGLPYIRK